MVHPRLPGEKEKLVPWDASEAVALARAAGWHTVKPHGAVSVVPGRSDESEDSEEDEAEAEEEDDSDTSEDEEVEAYIARMERIDPKFYFYIKELSRVAVLVAKCQADLLFVNAALSPVQQRHLEVAMELAWRAQRRRIGKDAKEGSDANQSSVAVFDRYRTVLAIFARRASSQHGRLSIELAEAHEVKAKLGAAAVQGITTQMQRIAYDLSKKIPGCKKTGLLSRSGAARGVTTSFTSSPQITRQKQQRAIAEREKRSATEVWLMSIRAHLPTLCTFSRRPRTAWQVLLLFSLTQADVLDWEDGCDSPFWTSAKDLLAGPRSPPDREAISHLLAEEATTDPSDNAGCRLGQFTLTVWHLVHANSSLRAGVLRKKFGVVLLEIPWGPLLSWHSFGALTALRQRVKQDSRHLYPHIMSSTTPQCDEFLRKLTSAISSQALRSSTAAATRFLAAAVPYAPAVAAAIWTLALSTSSESEAQRELLTEGEVMVKSWFSQRKWPLHEILMSPWPLLELITTFEGKIAPASKMIPGRDPREPRCSLSRREDLAAGLEHQRVEAIVVYGRKDRIQILHKYLLRNLRRNGGVVDVVHFVVFAAFKEDMDYLTQLIADHAPDYAYPAVTGRRLAKFYSICQDPDTVYLKIDDDMVYLADEAIPEMVRERLRNRCGLVSANVINHAILSAVHQDIGAIRNFLPGEDASRPWIRNDEVLPIMAIEKKSQSQCVWSTWECGAWMHESFLSRLADDTACAYDFGWHDFHASGHGTFNGGRFFPLPHTRWSINMIAFKMEDVADAEPESLAEDDEKELSVVHPARLEKRSCAVGSALAAHFSYSRQEDGLVENTKLLERYLQWSERLAE